MIGYGYEFVLNSIVILNVNMNLNVNAIGIQFKMNVIWNLELNMYPYWI